MRRKAEIIIRCKKSIAILKTSIFSQSVCEWIFMACRQWSGARLFIQLKPIREMYETKFIVKRKNGKESKSYVNCIRCPPRTRFKIGHFIQSVN